MKSSINIFIRTRPTNRFANKNIQIDEQKGMIKINIPKKEEDGLINHQQENWSFKFDRIFLNQSQETVFEQTGLQAVDYVLEGVSSSVIAFGQTGSGKTFTTIGLNNDYRYRGLIPRSISHLFKKMNKNLDIQYTVKVNYIEIYNEMIHDLLQKDLQTNIILQEDPVYGIIPKGSALIEVRSEEEALELMFQGETNRKICAHKLNKNSSRSHAIFSLILEARSKVESSEKVIVSKLSIVDLAGSERTKKTNSEGDTLLEASFINKSLSYLEQLVVSFNNKNKNCLPYRQSKLTYLLKDSIGGNCKSMIIANIWPESSHLEETISTLRFASRMNVVENQIIQRIRLDPEAMLKKYETMVKDLKMELAMHDTLSGRGRISYEAYSAEQQRQQQQIAQDFLDNNIEDIEIESIRQVKELFYQFKNIYRNLLNNVKEQNSKVVQDEIKKILSKKSLEKQASSNVQNDLVGRQEFVNGFGLGKAPVDSVPQTWKKQNDQYKENQKPINVINQDKLKNTKTKTGTYSEEELGNYNLSSNKNQYFQQFKEDKGQPLVIQLRAMISELKTFLEYFENDKQSCQQLKQQIDKEQIYIKNNYKSPINYDELNDNQVAEINSFKALKKKYKYEYQNYIYHKKSIKKLEDDIQNKKQEILDAFSENLKETYNLSMTQLENNQDILEQDNNSQQKLNSQEEIYENALKRFKTTKKALKLEKMFGYNQIIKQYVL